MDYRNYSQLVDVTLLPLANTGNAFKQSHRLEQQALLKPFFRYGQNPPFYSLGHRMDFILKEEFP